MKLIEVRELNKHCIKLYNEYQKCIASNMYPCWIDLYKNKYDNAMLIRETIENMSSKIIDQGSLGLVYMIPVNTLDDYFKLYKLLSNIPNATISIIDVDTMYVRTSSNDFCEIE